MFCFVRWRESAAFRAHYVLSDELIAERGDPKMQLRSKGIYVGEGMGTIMEID